MHRCFQEIPLPSMVRMHKVNNGLQVGVNSLKKKPQFLFLPWRLIKFAQPFFVFETAGPSLPDHVVHLSISHWCQHSAFYQYSEQIGNSSSASAVSTCWVVLLILEWNVNVALHKLIHISVYLTNDFLETYLDDVELNVSDRKRSNQRSAQIDE